MAIARSHSTVGIHTQMILAAVDPALATIIVAAIGALGVPILTAMIVLIKYVNRMHEEIATLRADNKAKDALLARYDTAEIPKTRERADELRQVLLDALQIDPLEFPPVERTPVLWKSPFESLHRPYAPQPRVRRSGSGRGASSSRGSSGGSPPSESRPKSGRRLRKRDN